MAYFYLFFLFIIIAIEQNTTPVKQSNLGNTMTIVNVNNAIKMIVNDDNDEQQQNGKKLGEKRKRTKMEFHDDHHHGNDDDHDGDDDIGNFSNSADNFVRQTILTTCESMGDNHQSSTITINDEHYQELYSMIKRILDKCLLHEVIVLTNVFSFPVKKVSMKNLKILTKTLTINRHSLNSKKFFQIIYNNWIVYNQFFD